MSDSKLKSKQPETHLKKGTLVEAKDFSNVWYKSRVVEIDTVKNRVKIHFLGWNSRYDQWFDLNGQDIKVMNTEHKSNVKTTKKVPVNKKVPEIIVETYEIGAKVSAKWRFDDMFYPANVLRSVMKGTVLYYDVKFQDGFKKLVRSENVKRLVDDENDVSAGPIDDKKEAEARRAEAELLLAIQKPHVKDELTVDANNKPCENPEGNQRKSTRVKKLKTFKDEIVYYPPSSTKTYNIIIPEVESAEPTKVIKRKLSVNSIEADLTNVKVNVPVKKVKIQQTDHLKRAIPRSTREKKTNPLIQGYLKSVKLARSKKIKSTKSDHIISKEKKRKKKKDLIKKLIESSQLQLKKQQELIELQLKQHRHEKTKRKMLKLLKKQRLMEEQRNFTMENLNNIQKMNSNCSNNGQESSFLPIRCNFSNCDKTFRKQSLLEYHLKYHHYVDAKTFNNYDLEQIILSTPSVQLETTLASKSKSVSKKVDKDETFNKIEEDPDWQDIYSNDKNEDPYDIVHCSCGNHSSIGFMIQCEICLCWQHGDCLKLKSKDEVPDRHLCWLCTDPTNKLRELKYKSWLLVKNEKSSREILDSDSKTELKVEDMEKVNLLNICSKKYFNLNLLMHTIEYQHSLMNTINKQRDVEEIGANNRTMLNDKLEKLMLNILHLQDCATMKFEQFNKKLDEFETKYQKNNTNSLPRFFNLQELYKQLQSFVYT